jgi:hypothetical protein
MQAAVPESLCHIWLEHGPVYRAGNCGAMLFDARELYTIITNGEYRIVSDFAFPWYGGNYESDVDLFIIYEDVCDVRAAVFVTAERRLDQEWTKWSVADLRCLVGRGVLNMRLQI